MKKIVVLVSGNGSNLQAIINACQQNKINHGTVCAVFSNKIDAFALKRAKNANIPTHVLQMSHLGINNNREFFDYILMKKIDSYSPDLILLAGYMQILSSMFVTHYAGRLLNIHPSLLPKYPGLHTHQRVLENRDKIHGTSVHFVTDKVDNGPIILQSSILISSKESKNQVMNRIKEKEHILYPLVVKWFTDNRLTMYDNAAWLDGIKLPNQKLINSMQLDL